MPSRSSQQPLSTITGILLAVVICLVAAYLGPWQLMAGLERMPGTSGDSRLNNYFLENVYLHFAGQSDSVWHLPIYYPAPYALGFSDNHFGSAPLYAALRFAGLSAFSAYQWWFLLAYPLNFGAAVYFGRKMKLSWLGASVAALIFAYALPIAAQADHSQLQYRFGVPIAIAAFIAFLRHRSNRQLALAMIATVLQFFLGVYTGFFTLLLLAALLAAASCYPALRQSRSTSAILRGYGAAISTGPHRRWLWAIAAGCAAAMIWLFFPYVMAKLLYGVSRSWGEVRSMLPRWYSYLLADHSLWWPSASWPWPNLPMRHEHQLFPGLAALVFAAVGIWRGLTRRPRDNRELLIIWSLVTLVGVTIYLGYYASDGKRLFGNSVWQLFYGLPLASAIRAMSRIILILLLPIGYLAAVGIEGVVPNHRRWRELLLCAVAAVIIAENSAQRSDWSAKAEWQQRLDHMAAAYPAEATAAAKALFVAQIGRSDFIHELDALWLASSRGLATMNGYSGGEPPGYRRFYLDDCRELPRRVLFAQHIAGQTGNLAAYRRHMAGLVPLGFSGCEASWWQSPPAAMSFADRDYPQEDFDAITVAVGQKRRLADGHWQVTVTLTNEGTTRLASLGPARYIPRVEWLYESISDTAKPSRFYHRGYLPEDLRPGQTTTMSIILPGANVRPSGTLKVAVTQRHRKGGTLKSPDQKVPWESIPEAKGG